jgi:hypothetical protein
MVFRLAITLFLAVACNFGLNAMNPTSMEYGFEEPTIVQVQVDERRPDSLSGDIRKLWANICFSFLQILRWIAG